MTTACAIPLAIRETQTLTGAAQIWLVVNMPAAEQGTSLTSNAKSRFAPLLDPFPVPNRLISQNTPAALNPRAATTAPGTEVYVFGTRRLN